MILFLTMMVLPALARVPHDGELTYAFQMRLEDGRPFIYATLKNHTSAPMEFELPAGLRLNGKHEPCLPVVLGQDIQFKIPPGESKTLKIQALSLYIFQHTEGEYKAATFMDDSELKVSGKLQNVWDLHYRNQLPADPFRICQIVVYLANGADVKQLNALYSAQEIMLARRI